MKLGSNNQFHKSSADMDEHGSDFAEATTDKWKRIL